jgi:DNA gyrase subunit A
VGPEKVIEKIRELHNSKRISGIADVTDLTDGEKGLHLLIEIKSGFLAEAVLEQLYRLTPLEETFGINNVCLVDGQPQTLGLKELLEVYLGHRMEVLRRRSQFRRARALDRLHLVEGLLVAIVDIDEVIAVIRASDDTNAARARLMEVFDLTEVQANYILEMPLRRLTKFSRIELETEQSQLKATIAELDELLGAPGALAALCAKEMSEVAAAHATPRRTVLLEGPTSQPRSAPARPLEVADEPCEVLLSSTGLLARRLLTARDGDEVPDAPRATHDVVVSRARATTRGDVGVVTSAGRVLRVGVLEMPALPDTAGPAVLAGGAPLGAFVELERAEAVVGLTSLDPNAPTVALGTAAGVVKRVARESAPNRDSWEVIRLDPDDRVVGVTEVDDDAELAFLTTDAQLLRFPATSVRPQGRAAGGMIGIRLSPGASVLAFGAWPRGEGVVVTIAGDSAALAGIGGTLKVTRAHLYPAKGRGTGGVRAHRFRTGEDCLTAGWITSWPAVAATAAGEPITVPDPDDRRDGTGAPIVAAWSAVAPRL